MDNCLNGTLPPKVFTHSSKSVPQYPGSLAAQHGSPDQAAPCRLAFAHEQGTLTGLPCSIEERLDHVANVGNQVERLPQSVDVKGPSGLDDDIMSLCTLQPRELTQLAIPQPWTMDAITQHPSRQIAPRAAKGIPQRPRMDLTRPCQHPSNRDTDDGQHVQSQFYGGSTGRPDMMPFVFAFLQAHPGSFQDAENDCHTALDRVSMVEHSKCSVPNIATRVARPLPLDRCHRGPSRLESFHELHQPFTRSIACQG